MDETIPYVRQMKITLIILFFFFGRVCDAQYVLRVQKQVLFDVLRVKSCEVLVSQQDSVIHAYQKEIADMAKTVSGCRVLNSDYENQISLLKQVNFTDQKEIILLNKDKKRLRRQNTILKILIPVVVGAVLYLDHR